MTHTLTTTWVQDRYGGGEIKVEITFTCATSKPVPKACERCGCPNMSVVDGDFRGEIAVSCLDCSWSVWWHRGKVITFVSARDIEQGAFDPADRLQTDQQAQLESWARDWLADDKGFNAAVAAATGETS